MSWQIENHWTSPESIPDNGNRLLVGNGYLGIRGTLEEASKASALPARWAARLTALP